MQRFSPPGMLTDFSVAKGNSLELEVVELAESRRHEFKKTPQFEFDLTFATTNISVDSFPLKISPDDIVKSKTHDI